MPGGIREDTRIRRRRHRDALCSQTPGRWPSRYCRRARPAACGYPLLWFGARRYRRPGSINDGSQYDRTAWPQRSIRLRTDYRETRPNGERRAGAHRKSSHPYIDFYAEQSRRLKRPCSSPRPRSGSAWFSRGGRHARWPPCALRNDCATANNARRIGTDNELRACANW